MENQTPVLVSDTAIHQIAGILSKEALGSFLRVSVSGGGCSGFQYGFAIDTKQDDDDLIIERGGAKVAVDQMSIEYMEGSVIDYVDDLIGASFQVKNPLATASCGCGTSFSI
jgi:iron-sulfur cluster assembly accessory protein